jgi:hypothetical protein
MLFGVERRAFSGLDPYIPTPEKPWSIARAAHLLRRGGFLPTWQEATAAASMSPAEVVDKLLDVTGDPSPPGAWTDEIPPEPTTVDEENAYRQWNSSNMTALRAWWTDLMVTRGMTGV